MQLSLFPENREERRAEINRCFVLKMTQEEQEFQDLEIYLDKNKAWCDEDGYPTSLAIHWVENTPCSFEHWIDRISRIWALRKIIIDESTGEVHISTWGWSGNEALVRAMQKNMTWDLHFFSHQVGGHYILKTRDRFLED